MPPPHTLFTFVYRTVMYTKLPFLQKFHKTGFASPEDMELFVNELYVYLIDEMQNASAKVGVCEVWAVV